MRWVTHRAQPLCKLLRSGSSGDVQQACQEHKGSKAPRQHRWRKPAQQPGFACRNEKSPCSTLLMRLRSEHHNGQPHLQHRVYNPFPKQVSKLLHSRDLRALCNHSIQEPLQGNRHLEGAYMCLAMAEAAAGEIQLRAEGNMLNTKDAISREPVPEGVMRMGR